MRSFNLLKGILPVVVIAGIILYVAYRTRPVLRPRRKWKRFDSPETIDLAKTSCYSLQGVYRIGAGKDFFGETAVLKCSYTVENNKTIYHLSLFCEKNGTYIICEGRLQGSDVLLFGHWRKAAANGTGVVQLTIQGYTTSDLSGKNHPQASLVAQGNYGDGDNEPDKAISLHFQQALPKLRPLDIVGHRGGARNVDFLPDSENTLEMFKMASRIGATAVEIDIRMTKDRIPVIFHDSFLSIHSVKNKIFGGLIHNYTLRELKGIELRKGGRIPTLQESLHCILYQTQLEMVWLDIKKECDMQEIVELQKVYEQKAKEASRDLRIYIGIPDKKILGCFAKLKDYRQIPSLTELTPEIALDINAQVWAPQYTKGLPNDDIDRIHAAGSKAFVWSLDNKALIHLYLEEGNFDGIVTNAPSIVAHWYYTSAIAKLMKEKDNQILSQ